MTPRTTVTSLWQKMALVFFGLVLALALLETGMRFAGFTLSSLQEYRNSRALKSMGSYRILCLGESTTSGQYPRVLERILNRKNIGMHFSVLDKGRPATNTSVILNQVGSYLNEYHPDMVIAMMGINDEEGHIPFDVPTTSKGALSIQRLKVYKLIGLLGRHLLEQAKIWGFFKTVADDEGSWKSRSCISGDGFKQVSGGMTSVEDSFREPMGFEPTNAQAFVRLARYYHEHDDFLKAEVLIKKAIALDPANDEAHFELGRIYKDQGRLSEAEDSLKKAIEINPDNENVYIKLGWLYCERHEFSQAERYYKRALEIDPESDVNHKDLGLFYVGRGRFLLAESSFKKAASINPNWYYPHLELGSLYRMHGELDKAEASFKEALRINPRNSRILVSLVMLYEELGKNELARLYAEKMGRSDFNSLSSVTIGNYRKLKKILDSKGIKLICVQYPVRSVGPLKKIFEGEKGVYFVDNERVFKDALKDASYEEYFIDMFGGDFGHCTPKGNKLLAQSIADVILEKVFAVRRTADQKQGLKRDAIL